MGEEPLQLSWLLQWIFPIDLPLQEIFQDVFPDLVQLSFVADDAFVRIPLPDGRTCVGS